MRAFGEKRVEARFCLRDRIGSGDADGIEAMRMRGRNEGLLDSRGVAQKSRSA
jgi:hypothetical protein